MRNSASKYKRATRKRNRLNEFAQYRTAAAYVEHTSFRMRSSFPLLAHCKRMTLSGSRFLQGKLLEGGDDMDI